MSKLVVFPNRGQTREEACSWLVSIDEGLTLDERVKLADWLAADPSHFRVLLDAAADWVEQSASQNYLSSPLCAPTTGRVWDGIEPDLQVRWLWPLC